jgi:prepilin-type processing-associated H-X9-DG protein
VCFSTQKDVTYSYEKKDFNDESGTESLELAYALTVHKAQGSQFDTVILILAEPCRIISRELLYTALTRQKNKIIILYNQEPYHLMKYSSEMHSDIAKRFTDLFADVFPDDNGAHRPEITKIGDTFFDEKLIHKTAKGELVRSKSEVIIANALFYNGLTYEYEPTLVLGGKVKRPDFKSAYKFISYGYNWKYIGSGGKVSTAGKITVRATRMRNPSVKIAFAESMYSSGTNYYNDGYFNVTHTTTSTDGVMAPRHFSRSLLKGSLNVTFADGHVETYKDFTVGDHDNTEKRA